MAIKFIHFISYCISQLLALPALTESDTLTKTGCFGPLACQNFLGKDSKAEKMDWRTGIMGKRAPKHMRLCLKSVRLQFKKQLMPVYHESILLFKVVTI